MTNDVKSSAQSSSGRAKKPERLSGHPLVDYLIEHPDAQGNFKWHTLRSCMWRRLLSVCPQYAPYADYGKISTRDAKTILFAQWQLISRFHVELFTPNDWRDLLSVHPELADYCDLDGLWGYTWVEILMAQPSLAPKCRWEKISILGWRNLLRKREEFADRCPLERFSGNDWSRRGCCPAERPAMMARPFCLPAGIIEVPSTAGTGNTICWGTPSTILLR